MQIVADLHTHTNVTTHAYSSLSEMVRAAKEAGLLALAITNHGPAMDDGAHQWHFANLSILPRVIDGVVVLRGIECNILPPMGAVDQIEYKYYKELEYVIASFHDPIYKPASFEAHTVAMENVLRDPFITTLGHPGTPSFKFDYERIISQCNEYGKIVEINNNSINVRRGCQENCLEIARLCKKYEVPVVVSSDAHITYQVGKFDNALAMLEEAAFPEELVVNSSKERLAAYFRKIRGLELFPEG